MKFIVLCITLLSLTSFAQEEESESEYQDEFQTQLNYLTERYEGYFEHLQKVAQWERERNQGAQAFKDYRRQLEREMELSRQEFVRNRKVKEEDPNLELEFNRMVAAREREMETHRKAYIRRRDALIRVKEGAKRIPEEKELGLTP